MERESMDLAGSAVLVVIDMQKTYLDPDGGLSRNGVDISPLRSVIPPTVRLIQESQSRGIPGIYTRQIYYAQDKGMASKRIWPITRPSSDAESHGGLHPVPYAVEGTEDAEIVDEIRTLIRPAPQDRVIEKPRFSAFYQTGLENLLTVIGTRTLIICGVTTNVCVDSTVRDAFFRNFDVLVVREAVGSAQTDLQEAFLKNFDLFFGRVVGLEEVLDLMSTGSSHPIGSLGDPRV
jgi:ureidoacrylate peracid hydrolase